MIIHDDIIQQSEEWYKIRRGKITASHATAIANCGKGLDNYILEVMADYFSCAEKEQFSNKHTERGNELEPIARSIYEIETGNTVKQVGFIEYNDYVGCSPDGLVGDDGGIEIKCPDDKEYFKLLLEYVFFKEGAISSDYMWQVQMNLLITERKWWDLIFYNPNYKQTIIVFRIYPDEEAHKKLKQGFIIAEKKIKTIIKQFE